jgi:hypothetical protein
MALTSSTALREDFQMRNKSKVQIKLPGHLVFRENPDAKLSRTSAAGKCFRMTKQL